jgi:dihydrofolate reductase
MRKLIFAINLTLDGCCDHTKLSGSDEVLAYHTQLLRDVDVFLYGRKTYELMVPFWPDVAKNQSGQTRAMNEFAQAFASVEKIVVFSRTLERTEGGNTRIVRSGLQDEVLKLKEEPGGNILTGGVSIASQLVELGLVDEFQFVVQPIVVGEGRRLFDALSLPEKLQLTLVESKILESGVVALRYANPS